MKFQLSVIIICRNEVESIGNTLQSALTLSDDIVVFDSGSTDGTLDVIKRYPAQLHTGTWEGFGKTRQKAVELAAHDWVLILDADEEITPALAEELRNLLPPDTHTAYRIRLKNHMGEQYIHFGDWGNDFRLRLYNRQKIRWNDGIVHEKLMVGDDIRQLNLKQTIRHQTARDIDELSTKMVQYALLTAKQYYQRGKRSNWIKKHISPAYTFLKNYIFLLGFLDGRNGYVIARMISFYTFLKYSRLHELWLEGEKQD